jgi:hypothetical protein
MEGEMTDQELLTSALAEALAAHVEHGVLGVAEPRSARVMARAMGVAELVDEQAHQAELELLLARAAYATSTRDLAALVDWDLDRLAELLDLVDLDAVLTRAPVGVAA